MVAPLNWTSKFETGNYAWQVTMNGNNDVKSEVWLFSTPTKEEADFRIFTMCGYEINIITLSNKDIDNLSGTGFIYLWKDSPKIEFTFNGLTVRHCGLTNGKKTDWKVSKGYIGGDLSKFFQPITLNPKDIDGDFYLTLKSFSVNSELNPFYDKDKGYYKIEQGDKGEGCKRRVYTQLEWQTPFSELVETQETQGTENYESIKIKLAAQELILFDPNESTGKKENQIALFGNINFDKDVLIKPDHPKKTSLTIEKGSYFSVNGNEVSATLNGKFTVADGEYKNEDADLGGDYQEHYLKYSFYQEKSLLLSLTLDENFTKNWNAEGSIFSELKGQIAWAKLGSKNQPGDFHITGVLYPNLEVKIKLSNKSDASITFKNAFINENGFYLDSDGEIANNVKFNAFTSTVSTSTMKIFQGQLISLEIEGNLDVPFINAKAPFFITAYYDGSPVGEIANIAYKATTVVDNGVDKITCTPLSATLDYDKVYLNANFSFANNQNKNVSADGVYMKDIIIYANGDVKSKYPQSGYVDSQVDATFNTFPYKINRAAIDGTGVDKHYVFSFWGNITLEENTLASKNEFATTIAFYQPENDKDLFYDSINLMASADENIVSGITKSSKNYNYNLIVNSNEVCASVSPNGLSKYSGCFKYFSENDLPYGPIYGSGFMLITDSTFYNPMEKKLHTKIIVGKKNNYRYWFLEAEQQGFAEIETGILDIVITGFGGRVYYHMDHPGKDANINNSDYIPSDAKGFGLYGNAIIKTAGSDGKVMWGNVATEIQTTSNYGLSTITQRGDVYLFSSGVNEKDAKINAVANFTTHFTTPKYLEGYITVNGNVYDLLELNGTAHVKFADNDWHIYAGTKASPITAYVYPIGEELKAYFGIQRTNGKVIIGAGVSGELYGIHVGGCKCLVGKWGACVCSGCYGVDVSLGGSIDATATFPSLQLSGNFTLTGSAGASASICGVDLDPSLSATFTGGFSMPKPFCLAGGISFKTPWPFPDFDIKARWKDGDFSNTDNCN